jgi:hypothetical protein
VYDDTPKGPYHRRGEALEVSRQPGLSSALVDSDDIAGEGGFLPAVTERLGCYVYLLVDPRDGRILHVGTGTGDRCFRDPEYASGQRGRAILDTIREIRAAGQRVRVDILRHGLDPETAATVEAAVIEALGSNDLPDQGGNEASGVGRMSVGEINTRYGATPVKIRPEHSVVLISIPPAFRRSTDRQLYEMTRGWWKGGARRERARWAFSVSDGVVRAVYRITGWEPARAGNRWGFRGHRDPEMERQYAHRDVSEYVGNSAYYTLTYVNC